MKGSEVTLERAVAVLLAVALCLETGVTSGDHHEHHRKTWGHHHLSRQDRDSMTPEAQNNSKVLAQKGSVAKLRCYTEFLGDDMVTWLKRDEDQLLTVGQQVYSSVKRYQIGHVRHQKMWELSIRDVRHTDEGMYECQLTTHPPVSLFFTLEVVEAQAKIKGPPELHIHFGSKLLLHCEVEMATEPPMYVFWYHNETMINYDRTRDLHIQKRGYTSSLAIHNVTWTEAGVYTCEPHLAKATNITVHVGMGHHPIALQRDRGELTPSRAPSSTISLFSSTRQQPGLVLKLHLLLLLLLPLLSSLHSISFFTSFEPRI